MSQTASSFADATEKQQRVQEQYGVNTDLPVRAVNRSDKEVKWGYANVVHILMPGVPTYVPFQAMVHWQGHPYAKDLPGGKLHEQERRQQREHLRALHGVYENDDRWAAIPLVECYPIDSDVRFETVLLDPEGTSLSEETASASETEFLRQQLESMRSQMAHLAAQVKMNENAEAARASALIQTSDDLDHQVTTSKAIAPEHSMVGAAPERRPGGKVVKRVAAGEGPAVTKDA